jgi:hypothetical protein
MPIKSNIMVFQKEKLPCDMFRLIKKYYSTILTYEQFTVFIIYFIQIFSPLN